MTPIIYPIIRRNIVCFANDKQEHTRGYIVNNWVHTSLI